MKPVKVSWNVTQVTDGSVYKGQVTINGVKFEYSFTIKVPIQQWTAEPDLSTPEAICSFYQVQVKRGGMPLDLTIMEQLLFVVLLVEPVLDLYYDPLTRKLNASEALPLLADIGGSLTVGHSSPECDFALKPELHELLASPKFGCCA